MVIHIKISSGFHFRKNYGSFKNCRPPTQENVLQTTYDPVNRRGRTVVGPPVARWNPGSDYKRPPPHREEERHAAAELVWLAAAAAKCQNAANRK